MTAQTAWIIVNVILMALAAIFFVLHRIEDDACDAFTLAAFALILAAIAAASWGIMAVSAL